MNRRSLPRRPETGAARHPPSPGKPSPQLRVSLLAIVLIIAACAMAFTGLRTASKLWYSALYTFTAFLLLTAVLAARFRRGHERAFWFGFAVFGWGFFLMGLGPWMNPFSDDGEPVGHTLNPNLLTTPRDPLPAALLEDRNEPVGRDQCDHREHDRHRPPARDAHPRPRRRNPRRPVQAAPPRAHIGQVADRPGGPGPHRLSGGVDRVRRAIGPILPASGFPRTVARGSRAARPRCDRLSVVLVPDVPPSRLRADRPHGRGVGSTPRSSTARAGTIPARSPSSGGSRSTPSNGTTSTASSSGLDSGNWPTRSKEDGDVMDGDSTRSRGCERGRSITSSSDDARAGLRVALPLHARANEHRHGEAMEQ